MQECGYSFADDEFMEQQDSPGSEMERGSGSMGSDAPAQKPKGLPAPLSLRDADKKRKKKKS